MSNRLTIKGQVTIPKDVREFLGLTMGSSAVEFFIAEDGTVQVRKAQTPGRVQATGRETVRSCRQAGRSAVSHCDRVLALLSGTVA